jgi:hypothetical protein
MLGGIFRRKPLLVKALRKFKRIDRQVGIFLPSPAHGLQVQVQTSLLIAQFHPLRGVDGTINLVSQSQVDEAFLLAVAERYADGLATSAEFTSHRPKSRRCNSSGEIATATIAVEDKALRFLFMVRPIAADRRSDHCDR